MVVYFYIYIVISVSLVLYCRRLVYRRIPKFTGKQWTLTDLKVEDSLVYGRVKKIFIFLAVTSFALGLCFLFGWLNLFVK